MTLSLMSIRQKSIVVQIIQIMQEKQLIKNQSSELLSPKRILPSRFAILQFAMSRKQSQQHLLHNIEHQTMATIQSPDKKKKEILRSPATQLSGEDPKTKPMRRGECDMQMFKQIFVQPREQVLKKLKEKQVIEYQLKEVAKVQYDKILNIYDEERGKVNSLDSELRLDIKLQDIDKVIEKIDKNIELVPPSVNFFDQHIQVQPPAMPNASVASTLAPGNGYAPSVPLTSMMKEGRHNVKDLLVRAKAGMYASDIQKEAHLSFFLGIVYQSNKQYDESVKFYKKFLACANSLEDRIGMALGTNRIAINQFNRGDIELSIKYHLKNINLSDSQNSFAGYYNLGICYRKQQNFKEALQFFQKGLEWSLQRDDFESECLSYGQLGITYKEMELKQLAIQNFYRSRKQKKLRLQLDTLLHITRLNSDNLLTELQTSNSLLQNAFDSAKNAGDKKAYSLCICNIGIFKGSIAHKEMIEDIEVTPEIEFENQEDQSKLVEQLLCLDDD